MEVLGAQNKNRNAEKVVTTPNNNFTIYQVESFLKMLKNAEYEPNLPVLKSQL